MKMNLTKYHIKLSKALLAACLLMLCAGSALATNYHVILYVDGLADINTLTTAQKTALVTKYPPTTEQIASSGWASMTSAQKWTYWQANVMPQSLKNRITRYGVMPILSSELVEQYWLLAQEGTKYVFLLYVDVENGQGKAIKDWLDSQSGLRYWYGSSMLDACKSLYAARADTIAKAVGERIIKYPVQVIDSVTGQQVTKFVPIKDAIATYGATINPSVLLQYKDEILPMKIYDGSK